ncbi:hypothetical protein GCM10022225_38320 [Plantactinospora mayteni]|uniref:DUF397 domain-containing protein n=1 Tax=Plantactinospora mayteni TaxID=566021 RepID=A0ABQ4EWV2_9ACTN|nr:hypothetical protein Pma05_57210 [Plantactinospora mayteni]
MSPGDANTGRLPAAAERPAAKCREDDYSPVNVRLPDGKKRMLHTVPSRHDRSFGPACVDVVVTVEDIDVWGADLSALTGGLGWLFARPEPRETHQGLRATAP